MKPRRNHPADVATRAQAFVPQIALLDIEPPEMDGYQLTRQLTDSGVPCRRLTVTGRRRDEDCAAPQCAGFFLH